MSDDVRKVIYGTLVGFLLIVVAWLGLIYVSSCGFSLNCHQAAPLVIRTPIPTLIPVSHAESQGEDMMPAEFSGCLVSATDLIGAWVTAGSPETEAFPFTDANGGSCEGTYSEDIQHLFVENSTWYDGQLGCTSCHNADLTERSAGLDLSSYAGVVAGSNRSYEGAKGTDILGDGTWDSSALHQVLVAQGLGPDGHLPDAEPVAPVLIYAGQQVTVDEASLTPTATP